jgi:hypothetical protein
MSTGVIAVEGKCDLKNALLQYRNAQEVLVAVGPCGGARKYNLALLHKVRKETHMSARQLFVESEQIYTKT